MGKIRHSCLVIYILFSGFLITGAGSENNPLEDRRRELSLQVRCPVCQGQSIEDSNAPLALDLKKQIHEWLNKGYTDQQILAKLERQYGVAILMSPPFIPATYVLWLAPFMLFILISIILRRIFSSQSK